MRWMESLRSFYFRIKDRVKLAGYIIGNDFSPSYLVALIEYFGYKLGGVESYKSALPVNGHKGTLPWYTYPAIEYLSQYDVSKCHVFEYGSGNSSRFWAERATSIISVESNPDWHHIVTASLLDNQSLMLCSLKKDYVMSIHSEKQMYDIIIVDASYRFSCSVEALKCLNPGGLIILDNSDWHPGTSRLLRDNGFMQIDFIGMGPINSYPWCTSVFMKNSTTIPRKNDRTYVVGGLDQLAEDDSWLFVDVE
jgi:hypothetical protein